MKNRFRQIREYYGLSQAQFAQKIKMSPGYISNVETGRCNISVKTINVICEVFPINEDWLTNGEGKMFTEESEEHPVDKNGIAYRVKTVRIQTGLTQEEFGKRIGYSKMQIHAVEKGKVTPSNQFLEKIVREFKLNNDWMFRGVGSMEPKESGVDEQLINWLKEHPEVVRELRIRSGLG